MEEPKLSFSMRSMFRTCSRKVFFRYVAGVDPRSEDNPARAVGRAFHRGLEAWRQGKAVDDVYSMVLGEFVTDLTAQGVHSADLEDEVSKLKAYLLGYFERYKGDLEVGRWRIGVEVELSTKDEIGYIDALYLDNETGKVWGVEDKTRAVISEAKPRLLPMDEQLLTYALLLKANGYDVGGMIYRETVKTRFRRRIRESAEEFSLRVSEEYKTNSDEKYRETRVKLEPAELEQYRTEKYLADAVIRNCFKLPKELKYWARNTDSCLGIYGNCDYYRLCTSLPNPDSKEMNKHFCKGVKPPMDNGSFIKKILGVSNGSDT